MNREVLADLKRFFDKAGWNYTVFLRAFVAPTASGQTSEQIIKATLASALLSVESRRLANKKQSLRFGRRSLMWETTLPAQIRPRCNRKSSRGCWS